jgi:Fur family ferric uptake transcriptional regulator
MTEPINQLQMTLKKHHQSLTKPRQIVFDALLDKEPQTMAEIVKVCSSIDRASAYRTIALFEELGIVQRLQIGWKYKLELSDNFHHHHHHMTCLKCGQIIPFEEDLAFEKRLSSISRLHSFNMSGHQLEIQGLCQNCVKK